MTASEKKTATQTKQKVADTIKPNHRSIVPTEWNNTKRNTERDTMNLEDWSQNRSKPSNGIRDRKYYQMIWN